VVESASLIRLEAVNGVAVVGFTTTHIYDLATVDDLERQFRRLLDGQPDLAAGRMVIDFTGVEFMVTRVINTLLVVLKRVRSAGGEVVLCGMGTNVDRVIRLMRLDRVFATFPARQQALDSLRAGRA